MDFTGLTNKPDMKVEIPSETEMIMDGSGSGSGSGLTRQQSVTKNNCLCSPTTHAGSFRCRLHRSPSLQRTKSMEANAALRDTTSKANSTMTTTTTTNAR
ncbi:hypothetical protein PanWU01x14_125620 [Parasponia andersonii]|uniref:Serine-rich protein-like protein n=1 Tax=Parasponia andersonii TaxID=3476 RepID=A0A2P5CT67_PARAD|nr:hypothetical protein PanWU01x14_125620 [Parasponia andersonii]